MASKVLVVGGGAIGLRTALELLKRRIPIVLRSHCPPLHPSTCSMGAGGLWMPYKSDDPRVSDRWAIETLDELLPLAHKKNLKTSSSDEQDKNISSPPTCDLEYSDDDSSLVEIVPTVFLLGDHSGPNVDDFIASDYTTKTNSDEDAKTVMTPLPKWTKDSRLSFQHLTIEMLIWQNQAHKLRLPSQTTLLDAGFTHGWFFHPPVVDSPRFLESMFVKIFNHPFTMDVNVNMEKEYTSISEMVEDAKRLGCDSVINCTGFGAQSLCNDDSLFGGRGVLHHYDRETCIWRNDHEFNTNVNQNDVAILTEDGEWGTANHPSYIIPRGKKLCVGGTYLENDTEMSIRETEHSLMKRNAWNLGINTKDSDVVGNWVGWRPCRKPSVRLEIEEKQGVKVVHSYGHGGSGWTVFVGVAKDTVKLLLESHDRS